MRLFDRMSSGSLERHEMQPILFVCLGSIVIATGVGLFLYPVVFAQTVSAPARILTVGFFDLCILSILQAVYLGDRQRTIRRLRQQIGEERCSSSKAIKQASANLLETLANFSSFHAQLLIEYRRAAAGKQNLTVLVITTRVHGALSGASLSRPVLGIAAKAISRKLREEDSIYILAHGHFGIILPGVDALAARRISARLLEGLTDAAGASNRFSFQVDSISYPEQTSSAPDLELAITQLLPNNSLNETITRNVLTSR